MVKEALMGSQNFRSTREHPCSPATARIEPCTLLFRPCTHKLRSESNGTPCPLLSNNGQNVAVPRMSAMCQSRPTHRSKRHKQKDRQLRRSFRNPNRSFWIRRLQERQMPSASCAGRAGPMRQVQKQTKAEPPGVASNSLARV